MKDEALAVREDNSLLSVIERIVASGITPESVAAVSELLKMQERVIADQRKTAFMAAMARLQERLPQMDKHGQAKNSKFAKLEHIDSIIRPLLAEEGFSFSFDEEAHSEKTITFLAVLSHKEGHSETKRLTVPIDAAAKNRDGISIRPAIQDAGSTVSYARRYLIKMHLNIIERDEDTDAEDPKVISTDQATAIRDMIAETKSDMQKFLRLIAGVNSIEAIPARDYKRVIGALEDKKRAAK